MLSKNKKDQICFLLDATGSMDKYIKIVQSSLLEFFKVLQNLNVQKSMDLGFVFYRDFSEEDQEYIKQQLLSMPVGWQPQPKIEMSEFQPFTEEKCKQGSKEGTFYIILEEISQCCTGGGDGAEDIAGGIQAMLQLDWNTEGKKIAVLVTDAPCHGAQFHEKDFVDYYADLKQKPEADIFPQLEKLIKMDINLIIVQIDESTTKMNKEIENFYVRKEKMHKFQQFKLVNDLQDLKGKDKLSPDEIRYLSINLVSQLGKTIPKF